MIGGSETEIPEVVQHKLSETEMKQLEKQESRGLISLFNQSKLEMEAAKNWDKFYKRNEDRFFKDRHWTTREFIELVQNDSAKEKILLEIGCGVGNFFYPLLEEDSKYFVHACDFSKRAIDLVKKNTKFDETKINAFVCDVSKDELNIPLNCVDITSLIFVLSAILPCNYEKVMEKIYKLLRPGGLLLFRDYAVNDMAMLRFGPGCKLSENLYVRQDGTRAYYFSVNVLTTLFHRIGFEILSNEYVVRRTINKKDEIDCKRIFVQAKCRKPN